MQQLADQPAGVRAVARLGDGAERPRHAEPGRDDPGHLHRGGGDQPDPLPGVQVHLDQCAGARPHLVGDDLLEYLLAERLQLGGALAGDQAQGGVLRVGHVVRVLGAVQPEPGLLPGEAGDVAAGEEAPAVEADPEVEDRGPAQDGVVAVEEGGGPRVVRVGGVVLGGGSGCLAAPGALRVPGGLRLRGRPGVRRRPGACGRLGRGLPGRCRGGPQGGLRRLRRGLARQRGPRAGGAP